MYQKYNCKKSQLFLLCHPVSARYIFLPNEVIMSLIIFIQLPNELLYTKIGVTAWEL
jgi:hypothetical protein